MGGEQQFEQWLKQLAYRTGTTVEKEWKVSAEVAEIYQQIENTATAHDCRVDPPLRQQPQVSDIAVGGRISKVRWARDDIGERLASFLIKKGNPCIVKVVERESWPGYIINSQEYVKYVKILRAILQDLDERFEWLNSIAKESPQFRPSKTSSEIPGKPAMRCFKTGVPSCPKKLEADPKQVFIGMPFRPEFEDIYKYGIIPALKAAGLKAWKADESIKNIDVMCKICEGIQSSRYAIINISGWNPNVLFELGLAYGLGKETVLIKGHEEKVPADLRGMEYIEYRNSDELRKKLIKFFKR